MGHEDDGVALLVKLLEEHQHLERGVGVEVTSGLVGQQHSGLIDQGTGDGYTLHLTTRHLIGLVHQTVAQTDGLQRLDGCTATLARIVLRVVHQGQFHILYSGGLGQQVVVLEHEANLLVAQMGTLRLRHGADGNTVEQILARGGGVQTAQLVEQRRLARTGGSLDGDKLALVNLERDTTQGLHRFGAHLEVALYVL